MVSNVYGNSSISPTLTPTSTLTPTTTPTSTPTPTPTISVTPSPTPTLTPTPTPNPTNNVTLIGTNSASGNFGAGVKIKIPALQSGDLLVAVAGTNGSPSSWTTPAAWNAGTNSGHPDGEGLNWWWKIASGTESGSYVTLKASSYTDGGGVVLDYRGTSASPIQAVSSLATNDNGGKGQITSAVFNSVAWSGTANVVDLLLMSWQPNTATATWPDNYTLQATANDGYSFLAVGSNLTTQSISSFPALTATLSTVEAVIPTLQIAILTQ